MRWDRCALAVRWGVNSTGCNQVGSRSTTVPEQARASLSYGALPAGNHPATDILSLGWVLRILLHGAPDDGTAVTSPSTVVRMLLLPESFSFGHYPPCIVEWARLIVCVVNGLIPMSLR